MNYTNTHDSVICSHEQIGCLQKGDQLVFTMNSFRKKESNIYIIVRFEGVYLGKMLPFPKHNLLFTICYCNISDKLNLNFRTNALMYVNNKLNDSLYGEIEKVTRYVSIKSKLEIL